MKPILLILFVLLVAVVVFSTLVADAMFGIVAFTYSYLVFSLLAAMLLGFIWSMVYRRHALLVGCLIFGLLAVNYCLPPPSERLLRSALLQVPPGTPVEKIEAIVAETYAGSAYVLPRVSHERVDVRLEPVESVRQLDKFHYSLSSQDPSNVAAISFLIEDGVVVRSFFSAD